jgi:hypothetical protein
VEGVFARHSPLAAASKFWASFGQADLAAVVRAATGSEKDWCDGYCKQRTGNSQCSDGAS